MRRDQTATVVPAIVAALGLSVVGVAWRAWTGPRRSAEDGRVQQSHE